MTEHTWGLSGSSAICAGCGLSFRVIGALGAWDCDSGSDPKGEDASAAECGASQSGRSDSEGIAQNPAP